jgi:hypothetical protein
MPCHRNAILPLGILARRGLMIAAPAFDERDRPRQRRRLPARRSFVSALVSTGVFFDAVIPCFTTAGRGRRGAGTVVSSDIGNRVGLARQWHQYQDVRSGQPERSVINFRSQM